MDIQAKSFLLMITTFLSFNSFSQQLKLPRGEIGIISLGAIESGTGFVVNNSHYVVTCAHVIFDTTSRLFFITTKDFSTKKIYELKLIFLDAKSDLALLKSDSIICDSPWRADSIFEFKPREKVFYIGYNYSDKSLLGNLASVIEVGKSYSRDKSIRDFVDFIGIGKPGYSGSPLLRLNGKVVAILSQAWRQQNFKDTVSTIVNRAIPIQSVIKLIPLQSALHESLFPRQDIDSIDKILDKVIH